MAKNAMVIYHDNCNDGFGAAFAFWKWHAKNYDNVIYHAANYGSMWPDVDKTWDVYILDFSYAPEQLVKIAGRANYVRLLDHHKTAMEAWKEYDENECKPVPDNLYVTFDMGHSGAMLAYEYFVPDTGCLNNVAFSMFAMLEDRDLWKFQRKDTKAFHAYLSLANKTFGVWDSIGQTLLTDYGYQDIIDKGELLLLQFEKQCEEIVRIGRYPVTLYLKSDNYSGLICNCPPMFASDIGNILAKESGTFALTWYEDYEGRVKGSLRSIGDYDVSAIAKELGGGGHKNAAGFERTSIYHFNDLLIPF